MRHWIFLTLLLSVPKSHTIDLRLPPVQTRHFYNHNSGDQVIDEGWLELDIIVQDFKPEGALTFFGIGVEYDRCGMVLTDDDLIRENHRVRHVRHGKKVF